MPDMPLQVVSVTATSYNTEPDITIGFEPDSIMFTNRNTTAGDEIRISFDGSNDHGELVGGLVPALEFKTKRMKIWLKRIGAGTSSVHVMAGTVR